jgi:hypothetical protein
MAFLHLHLIICCLEHLINFCTFLFSFFNIYVHIFRPRPGAAGRTKLKWQLHGDRGPRVPHARSRRESRESSSQVLSTSVARTCTEVFIHTINRKPPGVTGLCPLVSTFIISIHCEHIYFYQVCSAAVCCKPTFQTLGCRRNSCTCPHLTLPNTGN